MRKDLINNQEEVLNFIKTEIKDEVINDHVYNAVENSFLRLNHYDLLRRIGQYGIKVKLKNGDIKHFLFVKIDFFLGVARVVVDTRGLAEKAKKLLPDTVFDFSTRNSLWFIPGVDETKK